MKLTNEILTAAIAGFEQQKRAIDERVAALRQMLHRNGAVPAAPATNGRRPLSAAARKRIAAGQKKRWAAVRGSEPQTVAKAARPKKRRLSRGKKGDYRGDQAAVGGVPKSAGEVTRTAVGKGSA